MARLFWKSAPVYLLAAGLIFACPVRSQAGIGTYLKNRGLDLADLFTFRVSGAKHGHGAGVMVRATALAQVGAVYFDGEHAGLDRRAFGVWRENRVQGALGPLACTSIDMKTIQGNSFAYAHTQWSQDEERGIVRNGLYWDDGRQDLLAIGVEIQPGILPGIEVRFHPLELIDFLIGWTTIDVLNDDLREGEQLEIPPGESVAPQTAETRSLPEPEPGFLHDVPPQKPATEALPPAEILPEGPATKNSPDKPKEESKDAAPKK